jgi:hypothetical protein
LAEQYDIEYRFCFISHCCNNNCINYDCPRNILVSYGSVSWNCGTIIIIITISEAESLTYSQIYSHSLKTAIIISYHYPNFTANGTTIITYALTKYRADFEKEEIEIES